MEQEGGEGEDHSDEDATRRLTINSTRCHDVTGCTRRLPTMSTRSPGFTTPTRCNRFESAFAFRVPSLLTSPCWSNASRTFPESLRKAH